MQRLLLVPKPLLVSVMRLSSERWVDVNFFAGIWNVFKLKAARYAGATSHRAAIEQVIETANAVPSVTIWFEQDAMFVTVHRLTVIFRKKIDQRTGLLLATVDRKAHLSRHRTKVMNKKHRVIAPVIAHDEHFASPARR